MMKRTFAWLSAVLLASAVALPLHAEEQHPAERMVIDTTNKVLERLRKDKAELQKDKSKIYPLVEELILPHFDFHKMSIWVLGKNWRKADAEQQKTFTAQFQNLLVRTYSTALLEYTDQKIEFQPFHAGEGDKKVTVKTRIVQNGGAADIPLNYSLYLNRQGEWKVYDISVDGISLVTNFRTSFASEVQQGGIPRLLAKLEEMNQGKGADSGK